MEKTHKSSGTEAVMEKGCRFVTISDPMTQRKTWWVGGEQKRQSSTPFTSTREHAASM